jgi:hypothetical protein
MDHGNASKAPFRSHRAPAANTWVHGYWLSPFGFSWKYLDIDVAMRDAKLAAARK